jgi:hypothetical protein
MRMQRVVITQTRPDYSNATRITGRLDEPP